VVADRERASGGGERLHDAFPQRSHARVAGGVEPEVHLPVVAHGAHEGAKALAVRDAVRVLHHDAVAERRARERQRVDLLPRLVRGSTAAPARIASVT